MKKNNLIRFVQSLVLLPVMTMSFQTGTVHNLGTLQNALAQQINIKADGQNALNQAKDAEAEILKIQAVAIDAYFEAHDMPLVGTGMKMAIEAKKNDLDWRLLPAIAVRESTGGKNDCIKVNHNAFGWGSCHIGFKSDDEAIETVARNLGGNNPKTSMHYDNKTTKEILQAYNPPSVVPKYAEQVMAIMNIIGDAEVAPTTNTTNS